MVGRVTLGHDAGGGGPPLLGGRRNRRTRSGAARFGDAGGMSGPGVNKVTKQAGAGGLRLAAISHGEVDESVLVCGSGGGGDGGDGEGEGVQWNTWRDKEREKRRKKRRPGIK